jgi:hypothetical protein
MRKIFIVLLLLPFLSLSAHAQFCASVIKPTAPDQRYSLNGDATVTDLETGLMWRRCSEGQSGENCSSGAASLYTWTQALQDVDSVNTTGGFAGYTDWRLPNIKELASLIEYQCRMPSINQTIFPLTTPSSYWSTFSVTTATQGLSNSMKGVRTSIFAATTTVFD